MDKETKRRIGIMLMGIIGVIALLSGVSYAAFSSNLAGTQIQGVKTGCLKVDMADNGNLSLTNQAPETDQNGLLSTPYTYTITNTCTTDAYYTATINVLDTSNLENISKIKVSLDGDSYLAPTIESELEEIPSVDTNATNIEKTYKLDEGYLKVGQTKTFDLRTWIDYDVTSITGKLSNKVIISSKASGNGTIDHPSNTPGYQVLSKSELLTNASYQAIAPNGDQLSGVIKIGEGENTKYYFRGNPNNYITFAGKTFRILSTNSDGSINIVLDSIYQTSTYGNLNTILTSFYNEISSEEKYIKTDQTFCEEKQDANGQYLAKLRVENYNPTTSCASSTLTKVGLLTADDLMYAGAKTGVVNTSFYLKASGSYYTTSHATSTTIYGYTTTNSIATIAKTTSSGIKPVITLKSDTLLYGEGTSSTPFYVSGTYGEAIEKYQDDVAPTIVYARVDEKWSNENKQISISAKDNPGGSGIAGYLISTSNTKPGATSSSWEASSSQKYNTINTYNNGNYYVFVKDEAGNISEGVKVTVEKVDKQAPTCTIRINPNGTITDYKTLTIISNDQHIDLEGYSWDIVEDKKDVIKVTENGIYTGYITDLAGNKGSCSAMVTSLHIAKLASAENFRSIIDPYLSEEDLEIKNVKFISNQELDKTNSIKEFDVSENGDKSVVAWLELNGTSEPSHEIYKPVDLYIGTTKSMLYANEDCSSMFGWNGYFTFYHVENFDATALNTSLTINMQEMFGAMGVDGTNPMTITGIENWDVSNVENMKEMFIETTTLTSLNLSGWDTSSVTNGTGMFCASGAYNNIVKGPKWTIPETQTNTCIPK